MDKTLKDPKRCLFCVFAMAALNYFDILCINKKSPYKDKKVGVNNSCDKFTNNAKMFDKIK